MKYTSFANRINSHETNETVLTLIDLSPSMDDSDWKPNRKAGAITANTELIDNKLKSHPEDKMGIVGFGGTASILHPPVCLKSNSASLKRALKNPGESPGTNFTAALNLAENCFLGKADQPSGNFITRMLAEIFIEAPSQDPRQTASDNNLKRIIMLTDGEHNLGGSPETVAKRLKNAGVIIDCIGIGGSPQDVDEQLLKQIASENPDGSIRYCFIGDKEQLLRKYQTLARHIRIA